MFVQYSTPIHDKDKNLCQMFSFTALYLNQRWFMYLRRMNFTIDKRYKGWYNQIVARYNKIRHRNRTFIEIFGIFWKIYGNESGKLKDGTTSLNRWSSWGPSWSSFDISMKFVVQWLYKKSTQHYTKWNLNASEEERGKKGVFFESFTWFFGKRNKNMSRGFFTWNWIYNILFLSFFHFFYTNNKKKHSCTCKMFHIYLYERSLLLCLFFIFATHYKNLSFVLFRKILKFCGLIHLFYVIHISVPYTHMFNVQKVLHWQRLLVLFIKMNGSSGHRLIRFDMSRSTKEVILGRWRTEQKKGCKKTRIWDEIMEMTHNLFCVLSKNNNNNSKKKHFSR